METLEESEFLKGKTIEWAGVVTKGPAGDVQFVMRFTDGTAYAVKGWQNEGYPTEMIVEETSN